jgi:thiamine biosynthesis lipoprotein
VENEVYRVTVAALTAEQAEVAAKVAFVRGPVRGLDFLVGLGLAGEMQLKNGEVRTVGEWPVGQEE